MLAFVLTTLLAAATPVPTASPTPAPPKTSSVTGELISVDAARGTMTLAKTFSKPKPVRSPGMILTLAITPSTELFRASRPATLADLKAGDHVVVRYLIVPGGGAALSVRAAEPPAPKGTPPVPTAVPASPR